MSEVDRLGERGGDRNPVAERRGVAEARRGGERGRVECRVSGRLLHPNRIGNQGSGFIDEEAQEQLHEAAPPSSDPTEADWTAPQTTLTLHGYFRVRTELWDTFDLGRVPLVGSTVDPPFDRFRPATSGVVPAGGCGDEGGATSTADCSSESIAFANMRLRLAPTIALSDDVRVNFLVDVFDNLVLGSTPDGFVVRQNDAGRFEREPRTPRGRSTNARTRSPGGWVRSR